MNSKSLGKKLKAYRAKQGWNLDQCAERIGISTKYLGDIERGYKTPKLETLISILNALNASADDVLQDSLSVGYQVKSNDLINTLNTMDATRRKQAMAIIESVIATLNDK